MHYPPVALAFPVNSLVKTLMRYNLLRQVMLSSVTKLFQDTSPFTFAFSCEIGYYFSNPSNPDIHLPVAYFMTTNSKRKSILPLTLDHFIEPLRAETPLIWV